MQGWGFCKFIITIILSLYTLFAYFLAWHPNILLHFKCFFTIYGQPVWLRHSRSIAHIATCTSFQPPLAVCRTNRKRSSFATKHFQRKSLKIFHLHPPPRRLVSFVAQINRKVRCWVTDTRTKYCNPRCASTQRVNNQSWWALWPGG